jgi:hypothetical protein
VKTRRVRRRLWLVVPLALVAVLALAPLGTGAGSRQQVIAAADSNGFRVEVMAIRVPQPRSEPDAATVRIAAFERSGGSWHRLGHGLTVGQSSGWFWKVVTSPYGVRSLTLSRPGGRYPSQIALRLLISPSIGPSAVFRFVVDQGKLVQVDV